MKQIIDYSRYKNSQVRALVWSLISPGMVTETGEYPACVSAQWCAQIYEQLTPYLEQLDKNPGPLLEWLENYKSWRLGIRFEAYWAFILEQLIKQNKISSYVEHIQIQEQNNHSKISLTKGELDFVYKEKDKNQYLNHLEIAVKFYLLKPNEFGYERLIGPNGCDWYERKLEHLFKKQLPLSNTLAAKSKLAELFDLSPDDISCQHQGLIKGMIFLPVTGEGQLNDNEKRILNHHCLTGLWGTMNNWYLSDPGQIGRWVMLDKLNWLVPQVYTSLTDDLYTAKEMEYKLKIHFHGTRRSVLIARLEYDEEQNLWLEQQRVMVVDKYWPSFRRENKMSLVEFNKEPEPTKGQGNKVQEKLSTGENE